MKTLVVVATTLEAERLTAPQRTRDIRVVVSGIGAVNAALATQRALLQKPCGLVLSVGIAGAYPHSGLGLADLALSSHMICAGLGAMDGETFLDLETLGFALHETPKTWNSIPAWIDAHRLAQDLGVAFGPMLTLETVTGDAQTAAMLEARFPGALTEGMEGAGVAHAALQLGVPALELRGVSNMVGPRDKSTWRIGAALDAVNAALGNVLAWLEEQP